MGHVLVTGATGYVGRELVRQLQERGDRVTGLGRSEPKGDLEYVQADLTDGAGLRQALKGKTYDCVMHLASLPGDTGDPQEMIGLNVNGCLNILEFARQSKTPRAIVASSVSAYEWYPGTKFNPPDYVPVDENHPCRPKDMYSVSKRMQEELAQTYFYQYEMATTVLRLTAVVGPRGSGGGRGWREIAENLAQGEKVQVPHFSAEEVCHYIDFRDVARMFIAAADSMETAGQIFNCCGPGPTSGAEFQESVEKLFPGIKVEFGFPWSMAQGQAISFSMDKAKQVFGFEPIYSLEDSLRSIKEWIDAGGLKETQKVDAGYESGVSTSE